MNDLINYLKELNNQKVLYSSAGGGNGSILLIQFENNSALWAWRYWEITYNDKLITNAEDDDTPIIGKMAVGANQLVNARVTNIILINENYNLGILFDNNYELWLYTEMEEEEIYKSICNWEYHVPQHDICYVVTSQLTIEISKYY